MFETVELGRSLDNDEYEARVPQLRTELLRVQRDLAQANFPVLVLMEGVEGAGKGDTLNILHTWLDARHLSTHAYGAPTEEERQRPEFWRYWRDLPPAGRIGIFVGSWYAALIRRGMKEDAEAPLAADLSRIRSLEKTLTDNGALIVKLWFHVSKQAQKRRFEALEAEKETRWRVTKEDWKHHKRYDRFLQVAGRVLRETSSGEAPWTLIEGADERHRNATVGQHLLERIQQRLALPSIHAVSKPPDPNLENAYTILDTLDLSRKADKTAYDSDLGLLQGRLNQLSHRVAKHELGVILVFEGPDAAGKGGAIRRVVQSLDARQYSVIPVSAPTAEERAHHYLWRFWRHLPRLGRVTIYDRSWYGRVLVERVEGLASEAEWRRAYQEINDFESQIVEYGIVVVKFWIQISAEEQLRRFKDRETKPWKQYKITPEDYRNQAKTNLYEVSANDMIGHTSTDGCPWTLVEGEDKRFARLKVLSTICERLEARL